MGHRFHHSAPDPFPNTTRLIARKVKFISALVVALVAGQTLSAQTNLLTGGYGNSRANADNLETVLGPGSVRNGTFGRLFALSVDGQVYAQPLFLQGVAIPNRGTHNVVFAATMHNTMYAFDADVPGLPLWSTNLGPAVPPSLYDSDDGPYRDITVENGILSTPVIDPVTGTLYAVAATIQNGLYFYHLHALDITTGSERFGSPGVITAAVAGTGEGSANGSVTFEAQHHLQRPALLLQNGLVYIAFGSHGDARPYHGWIMAYSASDVRRQVAVFNPTPNGYGGSFWQSGRGLTADDFGNIFAVSSNGDFDGISNYGDSVLKLRPTDLSLADWFTPYNAQVLNDTDDDLGSVGIIPIPGSSYVVTGGKEGTVYVTNRNSLGHQSSDDSQIPQAFSAGSFGLLFNMALWDRSDGAILYTHGANEVLKAWQFSGSGFSATPITRSLTAFGSPFQGMTLTTNRAKPGTGVLWVTQPISYPLPSQGMLVAYDATDLSNVLWDSTGDPDDAPGIFTKFANPTVANGKVYVPTMSNQLVVYGLRSATPPPQPVVTAVENAASYEGGAVAPGEIVVLLGQNLGPAVLVTGDFGPSGQLATQVVGTQVTFNGVAAPLLYTSNGAVAAIVPYEVRGAQTAAIQLTYNGRVSALQTVPLVETLPGIFTADASGLGQGAILNEDYSLNSPDNPVIAGAVVVLYATGGGLTGAGRTGRRAESADSMLGRTEVSINGEPAEVLYSGAAPSLVNGAMQVNVRVPNGVSGNPPIMLTVSGKSSPATVTVWVR